MLGKRSYVVYIKGPNIVVHCKCINKSNTRYNIKYVCQCELLATIAVPLLFPVFHDNLTLSLLEEAVVVITIQAFTGKVSLALNIQNL